MRAFRVQPVRGARRDPGAGQRGAGGCAAAPGRPGAGHPAQRGDRDHRGPAAAGGADRGPGRGAGHPGRRRPSWRTSSARCGWRWRRPSCCATATPTRGCTPGSASIAAHDTATSMIERLRAQLVRHQFALSLIPGRPAVSLAQHERIVAAIVARDPAAAEAAMRDHITSVIESLSSLAGSGQASAGRGAPRSRTAPVDTPQKRQEVDAPCPRSAAVTSPTCRRWSSAPRSRPRPWISSSG